MYQWPPQQMYLIPVLMQIESFQSFFQSSKIAGATTPDGLHHLDALTFKLLPWKFTKSLNFDVNELLRRTKMSNRMWLACDVLSLLFFYNGKSIFDQLGTKFYQVSAEVLTTIFHALIKRKLKHFIQKIFFIIFLLTITRTSFRMKGLSF